jgi:hypothetical protein
VPERKKAKTAVVHSIALGCGHEDLVKTKLFIKVSEKGKGKAFYFSCKILNISVRRRARAP